MIVIILSVFSNERIFQNQPLQQQQKSLDFSLLLNKDKMRGFLGEFLFSYIIRTYVRIHPYKIPIDINR